MSKLESPIQRDLLSKVSFFKDGARYSQLKPKDIENDLFNYHLQQLVKGELLTKTGELYSLTTKGKSLVTNIDEGDKKLPPNYKVSVYMCAVKNGKVLLSRRKKHPQYDYVGFPSGKIKYGEKMLETADREFAEETGLTAEFKVIGCLRQIRRNPEREIIEDGIFYVCYTSNTSGTITPASQEGEFFWEEVGKAKKLDKLFKPSVEIILQEIQKRLSKKIPWSHQFIYELEPYPEEY
jgi:ADP-ribose pyrophosphatase YjhB (NUDIX family)